MRARAANLKNRLDSLVNQLTLARPNADLLVAGIPNFVNGNGTIKTALLPDGVHPHQAGCDLMADTWSSAIQALP
jgi:lysophospholipase L1-like esterase